MRRSCLALAGLLVAAVASAHPDLEFLEDAVARDAARRPDDPAAHMQQGLVHLVAGAFDAALADFEHAAAHGADRDEVAAARGRVFLAAGWPRMAKVEFDQVLARQPERHGVLLERGRAWMALGKPDEAAADLGRAVARMAQPTPDHVFEHRDALLAAGRRDDAVRALDDGMTRVGRVPSLQLAAIELEENLERHEAALARIDELLRQNPRNEAWIARRGDILAHAGKTDAAREAWAKALRVIEERPAARRGQRVEELERRLRSTLTPAVTQTEEKP